MIGFGFGSESVQVEQLAILMSTCMRIDPSRRRLECMRQEEWEDPEVPELAHSRFVLPHCIGKGSGVSPSRLTVLFMLVWNDLVMQISFGEYPIFCRILKKPSLQTLSNAFCQFDESQIQRLALFSASFLELSYRRDLSYYAQHWYSAVIVAVASVTFIF